MKILAWACAGVLVLICPGLIAAIYAFNITGTSAKLLYDALLLFGGMAAIVIKNLVSEGQEQSRLNAEAADRSRKTERIGPPTGITSVRPDKSVRQMAVSIVNVVHLYTEWFPVLAFVFLAVLVMVDASLFGFELITLPIIGVLTAHFIYDYLRFKADPVALAATDSGLWFYPQRLFVPYERLLTIGLRDPAGEDGTGPRMVFFKIAVTRADRKHLGWTRLHRAWNRMTLEGNVLEIRLPGLDGDVSVPHQEIIQRIKELAAARNGREKIDVPRIVEEKGAEMLTGLQKINNI
jgi:hypothetical protein